MANGELPVYKEPDKYVIGKLIIYFILYIMLGIVLQAILKFTTFIIFSKTISNILITYVSITDVLVNIFVLSIIAILLIIAITYCDKHLKKIKENFRMYKIIGIVITTVVAIGVYRLFSIIGL